MAVKPTWRSFVASEKTRRCRPGEIATLSNPAFCGERLPVGIVRIPRPILTRIADAAEAIWGDSGTFWTAGDGQKILGDLLAGAGLTLSGPVRSLGPNRRPPGLRSTTFDKQHGLRIGLHIDSWDASALSNRGGTRNRLCLNLGSSNHYLYLVPLNVTEVLKHLGRPEDDKAEPDQVVREFCARHPYTQVLRLGVPPGFAYVAPTDAVIHDGGAAPSKGADIILTWLGQFSFTRSDWPLGREEDQP